MANQKLDALFDPANSSYSRRRTPEYIGGRTTDPFSDLFNVFSGQTAAAFPPCNSYTTEDGMLCITCPVAGYDPSEITVTYDTELSDIVIVGDVKEKVYTSDVSFTATEYYVNDFRRAIKVPRVGTDTLKAEIHNGELMITAQILAEEGPKVVTVKVKS